MNTLNIKTPLEKVCKPGKVIDQFQYIYFQNGYVYASNGRVHIKQGMELHNMGSKTQELLDGYCIHKDVLKHLRASKSKDDFSIHKGPVDVTRILKYSIAGNPCQVCIQHQSITPGKGKLIGEIDQAIADFKMVPTKKVTVIPESIELIRKSFVSKSTGYTFYMNGSKERMLITPNENEYNEIALLMPLMISGELKKV